MSVHAKNCEHELERNPSEWYDTAGRKWLDEACSKCGRIWHTLTRSRQ